jgi:glycosyltransferase involved in cell wall biosynthesis
MVNPARQKKFTASRSVLVARRQRIELTILMPCLNEAETIEACIKHAQSYLDRSGIVGEVLIADNGSSDGSQDIARQLNARVIHVAERGYGAALQTGIKQAKGHYIIMGDADGSYDFANLDYFISELRNGADLVMGNRFLGGIMPGAMPFLHKYIGNPILSLLGRLFFRIPVWDLLCGLRGFRTESIRKLQLRTTGMEFASEMVVRSAMANLKIKEVPTTLRPDGRTRAPHLRTWRDGWRYLKFLLMYSPRWLFVIPGSFFGFFGLLLAGAIFFGPFQFARNIVLDLNTFIFGCFMIALGVQVLTFGWVSQYYAEIMGMLPQSARVNTLAQYVTVDGLVWLAAVLFGVGFLLFGTAVGIWAKHDFGPLVHPLVPRLVITGMTLLVVGFQIFFSAFLFGIIGIPIRRG